MPIDTTIGGLSANSYASVAEADAYFSDRAHVTFWDAIADTSDKETLLITATNLLEWYVKWNGFPVTDTQALGWPRTGVFTELGNEIAPDVIPQQVKIAVFEMIVSSYAEDRTSDTGLEGLNMVKLSTLQIQTTDKHANPPRKVIPEKIWRVLRGLYAQSGIKVVRLMRA